MHIDIQQETADDLERYGTVSIAFTAYSRFRVEWVESGLGGIRLTEEKLSQSLFKDFDAEKGIGPPLGFTTDKV